MDEDHRGSYRGAQTIQNARRYVHISSLRDVWQYNVGGGFSRAYIIGKKMSRRVLAWSMAFVESIVEPFPASTPGDTGLPRAQAVYVSCLQVVYSSLEHTFAVRSSHLPRTGNVRVGARTHGLGLSRQLSRHPKEPVLQEIRGNLLFEHGVQVQSRWYLFGLGTPPQLVCRRYLGWVR